jgi:hypothetical protein
MKLIAVPAAALLLGVPACSQAQPTDPRSPLVLERTIALPDTKGRIDHLAIDLADHRLFVAEIANGTVDEVDPVFPSRKVSPGSQLSMSWLWPAAMARFGSIAPTAMNLRGSRLVTTPTTSASTRATAM